MARTSCPALLMFALTTEKIENNKGWLIQIKIVLFFFFKFLNLLIKIKIFLIFDERFKKIKNNQEEETFPKGI